MAKENSVIDWEKYGVLLKAARVANGFTRGLSLCKEVEEKTGMKVSERTIYAPPPPTSSWPFSRCCPSCATRNT